MIRRKQKIGPQIMLNVIQKKGLASPTDVYASEYLYEGADVSNSDKDESDPNRTNRMK